MVGVNGFRVYGLRGVGFRGMASGFQGFRVEGFGFVYIRVSVEGAEFGHRSFRL